MCYECNDMTPDDSALPIRERIVEAIRKSKKNMVMSRYAKKAKFLCGGLRDGQAMLIRNMGGETRLYVLENVDVRKRDRKDSYYADDAKYIYISPDNAIEMSADLSKPTWMD